MKTLTKNIIAALTPVLTANPFNMKMNETRLNLLETTIDNVLPVQSDNKLTDETRKLLPSLNGGAMFDTISENIVIHIPEFYRSTKTVNNHGKDLFYVPKQSITFTLPSYTVESVRYFALAIQGLAVQPNWQDLTPVHNTNCKLTELVDKIIPVLQGVQTITVLTTATVKDYPAIATKMGLEVFSSRVHTGYGSNGFDQHREDNSAISIYIDVSQADFAESLMTPKKGGTFTYKTTNNVKYDVVPSNIVEARQVVAVKYRFTVTKA